MFISYMLQVAVILFQTLHHTSNDILTQGEEIITSEYGIIFVINTLNVCTSIVKVAS